MANGLILGLAASDLAAYSGGSWATSLPLANLVTQQPSEVARSADAAVGSTRFTLDFGQVVPVTLVALINHNLSAAARIRFRLSGGAAAGFDATVRGREANTVVGQFPWGAFPWDGFDAKAIPASGLTTFYLSPSLAFGSTLAVEIVDPGNPDGYVQIGRFLAGLPMQPKFNFTYGAALGVIDDSAVSRSIGGQLWADVKPKRRTLKLSYDAMREGDAWGRVHDFEMQLGITGNLLAIYDPLAPEGLRARGTVYGRLLDLSDVVTANASVDAPYTASLSIEELI